MQATSTPAATLSDFQVLVGRDSTIATVPLISQSKTIECASQPQKYPAATTCSWTWRTLHRLLSAHLSGDSTTVFLLFPCHSGYEEIMDSALFIECDGGRLSCLYYPSVMGWGDAFYLLFSEPTQNPCQGSNSLSLLSLPFLMEIFIQLPVEEICLYVLF